LNKPVTETHKELFNPWRALMRNEGTTYELLAFADFMDALDAYIEQRVVELLTPPLDACTFCNGKPIVYKIREQLYCEACLQQSRDESKPYLAVFKPMIYRKHGGE
jgi:hypothetical protein